MKIGIDRVRVVIGDTDTAPHDGGMRASRMTYVAGNAMITACDQLQEKLLTEAARILESRKEEIEFDGAKFFVRQDPGQQVPMRRVVAQTTQPLLITVYEDYRAPDEFSYICAQVAEVEVDPETGAVKLHSFVTAHDVGTIINPLTHQGQIDGAAVMGVGQGLMEEIVIEQGKVTNNNLGDYKLPSIADLFELKTVLVSSGGGVGPHNAKPIGEFANNAPPAAIANAIADAVGVRLFNLPLRAETIYRALRAHQH